MGFLTSSRVVPHPVLALDEPNLSASEQLDTHLASAIAELSPSQPEQPKADSMSITGAVPATLSVKQMIEQSRQTVKAAHEKLQTNAAKVAQAAAALDSLGDDLGKEGDDLLAMVGQYKNDLG
jgi:hypothetical protein